MTDAPAGNALSTLALGQIGAMLQGQAGTEVRNAIV